LCLIDLVLYLSVFDSTENLVIYMKMAAKSTVILSESQALRAGGQ